MRVWSFYVFAAVWRFCVKQRFDKFYFRTESPELLHNQIKSLYSGLNSCTETTAKRDRMRDIQDFPSNFTRGSLERFNCANFFQIDYFILGWSEEHSVCFFADLVSQTYLNMYKIYVTTTRLLWSVNSDISSRILLFYLIWFNPRKWHAPQKSSFLKDGEHSLHHGNCLTFLWKTKNGSGAACEQNCVNFCFRRKLMLPYVLNLKSNWDFENRLPNEHKLIWTSV